MVPQWEAPTDRTATDAAITVRELTKRFGKQVTALDRISLEVPRGEFFGLFGPNGAGKTTLLKILTGQLAPTAGRAWVLGLDPTETPLAVRASVGIVPEAESPPSFLTVEEVLEFVWRLRKGEGPGGGAAAQKKKDQKRSGKVEGTAPPDPAQTHATNDDRRSVNGTSSYCSSELQQTVDHWLDYFDLGPKAQTQCRHLSRGQKQKVMLAAALLHEPPLLFLDEPFINLDPLVQRKLRGWLTDYIAGGGTVLMATHILEMAERLCTRVAIINEGRVVATASKAELDRAGRGLEQAFYEAVGYILDENEEDQENRVQPKSEAQARQAKAGVAVARQIPGAASTPPERGPAP